ncbi:MAG: hypothetical protein V7L31_18515 [Nostoc sp.]|uniref:hypothetical protein n=1 Tax=Nostoc sp. TaxID=1180 RepID=UPI002FF19AB7
MVRLKKAIACKSSTVRSLSSVFPLREIKKRSPNIHHAIPPFLLFFLCASAVR